MRDLYQRISRKPDRRNFGAIHPGFHRFPFALYDRKSVWPENRLLASRAFYGSTALLFEGRQTAVRHMQLRLILFSVR